MASPQLNFCKTAFNQIGRTKNLQVNLLLSLSSLFSIVFHNIQPLVPTLYNLVRQEVSSKVSDKVCLKIIIIQNHSHFVIQ